VLVENPHVSQFPVAPVVAVPALAEVRDAEEERSAKKDGCGEGPDQPQQSRHHVKHGSAFPPMVLCRMTLLHSGVFKKNATA